MHPIGMAKINPGIECSNYRTISLINHAGKIPLRVLLNRLKQDLDPYLAEEHKVIWALLRSYGVGNIVGRKVSNLRFADDIDLLQEQVARKI